MPNAFGWREAMGDHGRLRCFSTDWSGLQESEHVQKYYEEIFGRRDRYAVGGLQGSLV